MFENVGDLTININKILVANWLGDRLRIKYRNGLGIEIKGEAAYELWQTVRSKYTALSARTVINTSAIIVVKWTNDCQQAEIKLDNSAIENFYGQEAQELRRVLKAIQNESQQ